MHIEANGVSRALFKRMALPAHTPLLKTEASDVVSGGTGPEQLHVSTQKRRREGEMLIGRTEVSGRRSVE